MVEKSLKDFHKNRSKKDELRTSCKSCTLEGNEKYKQQNLKKVKNINKLSSRKYRVKHSERIKKAQKKRYYENLGNSRQSAKERSEKYRKKHVKRLATKRHTEDYRKKRKAYYEANKSEIFEKQRVRLKNNIQLRLASNLRRRISKLVRKSTKVGSAVCDLGCSVAELKALFEFQFYPHPKTGEMMSWKNYGLHGWHIDHIKPLTKFDLTDRKQFLEACHHTNLQPLWAEENWRKNKY